MGNRSGQTQVISFSDKFTNTINKGNHLTVTDTTMIKN